MKNIKDGKKTYPKIQFTLAKTKYDSCRQDKCYKMVNGTYLIYGKNNRKRCKKACNNNYEKP